MRFARVGEAGAERSLIGIGERWYAADRLVGELGPEFWASARPHEDQIRALPEVDVAGLRWGCPLSRPPAVIGIGQNYAAHAAESGAEPPRDPVIFFKLPSCLGGPCDDVMFPARYNTVDWEVELGVVVGRQAFLLESEAEAMEHVAGYVLANDLSERTLQLQRSGGQWAKGKCLPGFAPLGPWVVSPGELDPANVELRSFVNDDPRQESNTGDMIFSVPRLLVELSQCLRLEPGMVILTGTPQGVAMSGRFPYLRDGDVVTAEASGLGSQRFRMVAQ